MADDRHVRVSAAVSGQVQGVGFRWFIVREASGLGLVGWVANAPDGTVRIEAEGERAAVERLLALVRVGPPGASVNGVRSVEIEPLATESRFAVRSFAHPGD